MLLAVRVGRSVASHVEDPRAMVATTYAGLLTWADLTPARSGQKDYCRALIKQAGLSLFLRHSFATRPAFRDLRGLHGSSPAAPKGRPALNTIILSQFGPFVKTYVPRFSLC